MAATAVSAGLFVAGVASAAGASAEHEEFPTRNGSCVAQFVLGPAGPPGQSQRFFREPRFGQVVSSVARLPKAECFFFPE